MKVKYVLTFILCLLFTNYFYAQNDKSEHKNNILYIEAGGVGGYGSLNYERMFLLPKNFALSGRIGLSTLGILDFNKSFNPNLLIPMGATVLYGEEHRALLGIGQVIASTISANHNNGFPQRNTDLHTYLTLGYRYQKPSGGLILGINYTPIIEFQNNYRHWGGISIGYAF